jgi:hypothetical protein
MLASITNTPISAALWYRSRARAAAGQTQVPPSRHRYCLRRLRGRRRCEWSGDAEGEPTAHRSVAARKRNAGAARACRDSRSLCARFEARSRTHGARITRRAARANRARRQSIRCNLACRDTTCVHRNGNLRFSCTVCTSSSQTTHSPSCSAQNHSRRRSPRSTT